MFELVSLIFGGVLRLVPELSRLWEGQKQREHEQSMAKLQFELDVQRAELTLNQTVTEGKLLVEQKDAVTWSEAFKASAVRTGIKLVDGLNATVRPILTYWWCIILASAYKVAVFYLATKGGASWANAATLAWTTADQNIVMSIIGFWFVDRSLRKQNG